MRQRIPFGIDSYVRQQGSRRLQVLSGEHVAWTGRCRRSAKLHHFTRFDQVEQLVGASGADPDLGFMARLMALCSLHHHLAFRVLVEVYART